MSKLPPISLLKPSAQTTTLCALRSTSVTGETAAPVNTPLPTTLPPLEKAVIRLMEAHGLRISEVLNITPYDIAKNGTIKIKALKGSNNRLLAYSPEWQYLVKNRQNLPLIKAGYSRFYFYRLFKTLGIYSKIGQRSNNSVTHYFRHKIAADLRQSNFTPEDISLNLGHKKQSNSEHYGK